MAPTRMARSCKAPMEIFTESPNAAAPTIKARCLASLWDLARGNATDIRRSEIRYCDTLRPFAAIIPNAIAQVCAVCSSHSAIEGILSVTVILQQQSGEVA